VRAASQDEHRADEIRGELPKAQLPGAGQMSGHRQDLLDLRVLMDAV